jgi:beta-lactamase superfamily II metal-dependent hydrolase
VPPKRKRLRKKRIDDDLGFGLLTDRTLGFKREMSREQTKKLEQQRKQDIADKALAEAKRLRTALNQQAAIQPVRPPGSRGDGNFHLAFVQIGQGDCTVLSTPLGKVVVIDCGTNSSDNEARDEFTGRVMGVLEEDRFLKDHSVIDVLILTHPDRDHFNRLETMIPARCEGKVVTVYHTQLIGDYGPAADWVRRFVLDDNLIMRVVLNQVLDNNGAVVSGEITLGGQSVQLADAVNKVERRDATGGIIIVSEPNCTITLMAAGVSADYARDNDSIDHTNRGSIVTLVEVFGKKILLCADATRSTEHYLLNSPRAARLSQVHYVTAGHHGSDVTSSGQPFIDGVNPRERVIVSAANVGMPNHHLPSWPVINRWVQRMAASGRVAAVKHYVSAWDLDYSRYTPKVDAVSQAVFTTGSSGTQYLDILQPVNVQ